jgi:hypothetical protein
MSTIAHWKDGKIIEEYLHWDNESISLVLVPVSENLLQNYSQKKVPK